MDALSSRVEIKTQTMNVGLRDPMYIVTVRQGSRETRAFGLRDQAVTEAVRDFRILAKLHRLLAR